MQVLACAVRIQGMYRDLCALVQSTAKEAAKSGSCTKSQSSTGGPNSSSSSQASNSTAIPEALLQLLLALQWLVGCVAAARGASSKAAARAVEAVRLVMQQPVTLIDR